MALMPQAYPREAAHGTLIAVEFEKIAVRIVEEHQPPHALVRFGRQDIGRKFHTGIAEPLVHRVDVVDRKRDVAYAAV